MFRNFITLAAVAGLVAGASAQQNLPVEKVTNLSYGTYDFQNGLTKTNGNNRAVGPDTLYSTINCAAVYFGYIGPGNPFFKHEWVDEVQLPDRGVTGVEEVNGMTFAYCNLETLGYFDAVVSMYNDTVAGTGPSIWVDGQPIFADCLYLLNLPDNGCWNISLDLGCGFECILPQASNPNSGSSGTIGWSMTPYTLAVLHGPILETPACTQPGSVDSMSWRTWSNSSFGGAYYYVGSVGFGPASAQSDWLVEFRGSPEDVQGVYGTGTLDVLCLSSTTNPEPGGSLAMTVEGADVGNRTYVLLVNGGNPANAGMTNGNGTWTRQISLSPQVVSPFVATGPIFTRTLNIPGNLPNNSAAVAQMVRLNGPASPANVDQATNGLAFRL